MWNNSQEYLLKASVEDLMQPKLQEKIPTAGVGLWEKGKQILSPILCFFFFHFLGSVH